MQPRAARANDGYDAAKARAVAEFVRTHAPAVAPAAPVQPAAPWRSLLARGSALWLESASLAACADHAPATFAGVATEPALWHEELQRGGASDLATAAAAMLRRFDGEMPLGERLAEMQFVLQAVHGLATVRTFGGGFAASPHANLVDDVGGLCAWGRRLAALAPEACVVRVPLTPAGLLAARQLAADGVRVDCTLVFSPRQAALAARCARPESIGVHVGCIARLLPDAPLDVGVVAARACRPVLRPLATALRATTPRDAAQLAQLAGTDVLSLRADVAAEFVARHRTLLPATPTELRPTRDQRQALRALDAEVFVTPPPPLRTAAAAVAAATDGPAVRAALAAHGLAALLPDLSFADHARVAEDGEVPDPAFWRERVAAGEVAWDGLLNAAALQHLVADQARLDACTARFA